MLVAPVSRSAIVIGKCLGGATVSTFQVIIILAPAGLAHVQCDPVLILTVIGELLLLSFTLAAYGVMMAVRITRIQAFIALTQMLVMPLIAASGALYPLRALPPGWPWSPGSTRSPPRYPRAARGLQSPMRPARRERGAVPGSPRVCRPASPGPCSGWDAREFQRTE